MNDLIHELDQFPDHLKYQIILGLFPDKFSKLEKMIHISEDLRSKYFSHWKKYIDLKNKLLRLLEDITKSIEVEIFIDLDFKILEEIGKAGYFDLIQNYQTHYLSKLSQGDNLDPIYRGINYLEPILFGAVSGGKIKLFDWLVSQIDSSERLDKIFPNLIRKAIQEGQTEMIEHLYHRYRFFQEDLKHNPQSLTNALLQASIAKGDFNLFQKTINLLGITDRPSDPYLIKYLYRLGNQNWNPKIIEVLDHIGNLSEADYLEILSNSYDLEMINHLISILSKMNKDRTKSDILNYDDLIPNRELNEIIRLIIDRERLDSFRFIFDELDIWNDPIYFNYYDLNPENIEFDSILDPFQIAYQIIETENPELLRYFLVNFDPNHIIPKHSFIKYLNRLYIYAMGITNSPENPIVNILKQFVDSF